MRDLSSDTEKALRQGVNPSSLPTDDSAGVSELLANLKEINVKGLKGDKGEQGNPGQDGQRGKDGRDGRDGKDGRDGVDGQDGQNGLDGKPGPIGPAGPQGKQGPKGEDGTHTVVHVHEGSGGGGGGLELVRGNGAIKKQGVSQIDFGTNLTVTPTSNGVRVDGAAGGTGVTLTPETPTGTVDDSNLSFSVGNTPVFISINGLVYMAGTGIFASYAGGTITLNSPVGTGGFIISFYNA